MLSLGLINSVDSDFVERKKKMIKALKSGQQGRLLGTMFRSDREFAETEMF